MIEIPDKWKALKCTEAWLQFRELMDTAVSTLLKEARDELEVMDAYRVVLRALSVATEVVHVKLREDGKAVFVISHQRPEALADDMNWLDTAGRRRGFMLLRWIHCPKVEAPEIRLAAIGDLWG